MPAVQQVNEVGPGQSRFEAQLDALCEKGIFWVVMAIMVWGPLAFGGHTETTFVVIQALTIITLGLWAVRVWIQRPFRMLWPPVCWAVLAFVLYALIRCHFVLLEYVATQELAQVIVYASLFFVVLNNFQRRDSATILALCLIVLGMVLSWDAVFQYATKYPRIWGFPRREQFFARGGATYINPDHFADFLAMIIPLALSYMVMSRLKHTTKVLLAYCAVAMLAGIGVSESRGGILAAGVALAVFCLILLFQNRLWLPALGILVGLIALAIAFGVQFESVQKRFAEGFASGKVDDPRLDYWSAAIHVFKDHLMWGAGPGHFDSEFARYRPQAVQARPIYAHNEYLNTLADWGAAGLAIVLAACALVYYGALETWLAFRQGNSEEGRSFKSDRLAFLVGACVGLLAILLHSVVDFNMHIPANAVIAVTLMAMISAHRRFATERLWKNPRWLGKIVLTIMLGAAMFWLTAQDLRAGREAYWMWRAGNRSIPVSEQVGALEKAYETEPNNYEHSYDLGEYYRLCSQEGKPGYEEQARTAVGWYAKSMAANPLDAWVPIRYGMCLDWIGETNKAGPYFDLAAKLDPNSYHITYFVGRHFVETGDYNTAMFWFKRSLAIHWNELARYAYDSLKERMADPYKLYEK